MSAMNFGIVGCGLIGEKRAKALIRSGLTLVACSDINIDRAQNLATLTNAKVFRDWRDLVRSSSVNIVVASTIHNSLAEITCLAAEAGKHVFVEKPAGRNSIELEIVMREIEKYGVKVRVGFNHRFHKSLLKARSIIDSGALGDLMFLRGRYGHGGRLGYNKEWRADAFLSGGGELIDQGSHLIDLTRWFLGEINSVQGFAKTFFWDMSVEDNGFMLLKTKENKVAFLHASCTEWKNLFSMEIYGKLGKIDISGLGGSYGTEKITWFKMLPRMGPPDTISWEYPGEDNSWEIELNEFVDDIRLDREPNPSIKDAHKTLKIIETIYKESGIDYSS